MHHGIVGYERHSRQHIQTRFTTTVQLHSARLAVQEAALLKIADVGTCSSDFAWSSPRILDLSLSSSWWLDLAPLVGECGKICRKNTVLKVVEEATVTSCCMLIRNQKDSEKNTKKKKIGR